MTTDRPTDSDLDRWLALAEAATPERDVYAWIQKHARPTGTANVVKVRSDDLEHMLHEFSVHLCIAAVPRLVRAYRELQDDCNLIQEEMLHKHELWNDQLTRADLAEQRCRDLEAGLAKIAEILEKEDGESPIGAAERVMSVLRDWISIAGERLLGATFSEDCRKQAEAQVERLREALGRIRDEHQNYDDPKIYTGNSYGVGVVDGHRCAALIARAALEETERET
jgi:hypothetical protein